MIYLDTSALLAFLLAEDRSPPEELWDEALVASRLVDYEATVRIRALGLERSHGEALRKALARIGFLEMVGPVLERALEPFPVPVRTLEALHLASADFLREQGAEVRLATYDRGLEEAARALELSLVPLG